MAEREIPLPSGTVTDIKRVRSVMSHRVHEERSEINQPASDKVPGEGSGDQ